MERFSERIGIAKPDRTLKVDSMSTALRSSLWNLFLELYDDRAERYWRLVAKHIAKFFRKVPTDELPYENFRVREWVKEYFLELEWHDAYDLLEFVVHNHRDMTVVGTGFNAFFHPVDSDRLVAIVNGILERELSGFRFVQKVLTPITSPGEIAEIEGAAETAQKSGLRGACEHIQTALELFGRKPEPDYRNAIKESISAVESVAKQIAKNDSATLDPALKALADKVQIHPALISGFLRLYGYTSDEQGIRHAILDEPNVGFAEAKYMIVACSAFVNYLIVKAEQAGLLE